MDVNTVRATLPFRFRTFVLALMFLATIPGVPARADALGPAIAPVPNENLDHARRLKIAGKVVTAIGTIVMGATFALALSLQFDPAQSTEPPGGGLFGPGFMESIAAITTGVVGSGMMLVGIPLWAVGARRENRMRRSVALTPASLVVTF